MKQCSYCGRDNHDEVDYCFECGSQFRPKSSPIPDTQSIVAVGTSPTLVEASASEPLWSARDAWKCLGMFLVFEFVMNFTSGAIGVVIPGFRHLWRSGTGHFGFSLLYYAGYILISLYFARTQSLPSFLKAFGLIGSPISYIWFEVVVTLAIRVTGHLVISAGWSRGVSTISLWGFARSFGLERYLYLAPALMAPFGEELYMRGFLYRAFRGSYSVAVSTLLILGITAVTHWNQFHHSWIAVVDISALTMLQCFLRERTGNLWDCILCHLVFNATGAFASLPLR